MTVDDPLRRLTAGLAEDERIARAATGPAHPGEWTAKADDNIHWIHSGGEEVAQSLGRPVQVGPHIAPPGPGHHVAPGGRDTEGGRAAEPGDRPVS